MSAIKFPDPIFAASQIKKQRKPLQRKSWKLKHNPMRVKMHVMKPAEEAVSRPFTTGRAKNSPHWTRQMPAIG